MHIPAGGIWDIASVLHVFFMISPSIKSNCIVLPNIGSMMTSSYYLILLPSIQRNMAFLQPCIRPMSLPQKPLPPRSLPNWMRYSEHRAVIQPQAWIRTGICAVICGVVRKATENSWISCIQNHFKMKHDTILSAEISPRKFLFQIQLGGNVLNEMVQLDFVTGELNNWIVRRIKRPLRDHNFS